MTWIRIAAANQLQDDEVVAVSVQNMKLALYGPDAGENARRLRAAHAAASGGVPLRTVHGDGGVFAPGASVLFFDAPIDAPPFHGHPLHAQLYAFEGARA